MAWLFSVNLASPEADELGMETECRKLTLLPLLLPKADVMTAFRRKAWVQKRLAKPDGFDEAVSGRGGEGDNVTACRCSEDGRTSATEADRLCIRGS